MVSGALDVVWPCFLNQDGKQKPIYKYGVPTCNLGPTLILYIHFMMIYIYIYIKIYLYLHIIYIIEVQKTTLKLLS